MILDFHHALSIDALVSYAQIEDLKIGLTSGCYDLTHFYHLRYWERCKQHCDILIVGVDSDYVVKKSKGESRPIFGEYQRLRMVEHSRVVDGVFLMNDVQDFKTMAMELNPYAIFKNQDFKDIDILGSDHCEHVIIIEDIEEETSTTEFINKIQGINKSHQVVNREMEGNPKVVYDSKVIDKENDCQHDSKYICHAAKCTTSKGRYVYCGCKELKKPYIKNFKQCIYDEDFNCDKYGGMRIIVPPYKCDDADFEICKSLKKIEEEK